jgi:hypothetical protein
MEAKADELWRLGELKPVEVGVQGVRQAQEITTALNLWDRADKIWYRFGITPSERTHLRTPKGEPKDPLAAHLAKRPKVPKGEMA